MRGSIIKDAQPVLYQLLRSPACDGFDAPHTSSHTAFRDNAEQTNVAGLPDVCSSAQLLTKGLLGHADLDDADMLPILLTK